MMKKVLGSFVFLIFVPFSSFAEKNNPYNISENEGMFSALGPVCMDLLEKEITNLELPEGTTTVYPETIGYEFFNLIFNLPDGEIKEYQFEYVTDDDRTECVEIKPNDWVY